MARLSSSLPVLIPPKRKCRRSWRHSGSLALYTVLFSRVIIWYVDLGCQCWGSSGPVNQSRGSDLLAPCEELKTLLDYLIGYFPFTPAYREAKASACGQQNAGELIRNTGGTSFRGSQCDLLRTHVAARPCLAPIGNKECASEKSFSGPASQGFATSEERLLIRLADGSRPILRHSASSGRRRIRRAATKTDLGRDIHGTPPDDLGIIEPEEWTTSGNAAVVGADGDA